MATPLNDEAIEQLLEPFRAAVKVQVGRMVRPRARTCLVLRSGRCGQANERQQCQQGRC